MFFKENLILAIESLRSNKMRAFLTMLGIIIGIASVIAIMSVGNSLSTSVTSELSSMGTNNYRIGVRELNNQYASSQGPNRQGALVGAIAEDKDLISDVMISDLLINLGEQIDAYSLSESVTSGQVRDGRLYANVSVTGVNTGYVSVNSLELISGRFINERDLAGRKSVAVVSDKLATNIFGTVNDAMGQEIRFYDNEGIKTYTIIGVYEYIEVSLFGSTSVSEKDLQTSLFIPLTLAKQEMANKNYASVTVMSHDGVDPDRFTADAEAILSKYYDNNPKWEISVMSTSNQIDELNSILSTLSLAISIIAAISLGVGGVGVMNIMLVSVTERTREIGIRKALGAKNYHIRLQFITEAMIICLVGGIIGLILGLTMGYAGSVMIGATAALSVPAIMTAIGFSMAIGMFFGYYPANKAAKLDPIDALRYE